MSTIPYSPTPLMKKKHPFSNEMLFFSVLSLLIPFYAIAVFISGFIVKHNDKVDGVNYDYSIFNAGFIICGVIAAFEVLMLGLMAPSFIHAIHMAIEAYAAVG